MIYSNLDKVTYGTSVPVSQTNALVSRVDLPRVEISNTAPDAMYRKECDTVVSEDICIQADLKIDPKLCVGEIKTFCGDAKIGKCNRMPCQNDSCEFSVSQKICIEIPLKFSADAKVDSVGHICGEPELKPCRKCE